MANFEGHLRAGVISYSLFVVASTAIALYGAIPMAVAVVVALSLPITIIGSVFPDIDHRNSKPFRFLRKSLSILVIGILPIVTYLNGSTVKQMFMSFHHPGIIVGITSVAGGGLLAALVWYALPVIQPKHRGMTHTFFTGVSVAGGVGWVGGTVASVIVPFNSVPSFVFFIVVGVSFLVGFCSHLYLDGMLLKKHVYLYPLA